MGVTNFPQKCFKLLNHLFLYTIILNLYFKKQFSINMTYIYKRVRDIY